VRDFKNVTLGNSVAPWRWS